MELLLHSALSVLAVAVALQDLLVEHLELVLLETPATPEQLLLTFFKAVELLRQEAAVAVLVDLQSIILVLMPADLVAQAKGLQLSESLRLMAVVDLLNLTKLKVEMVAVVLVLPLLTVAVVLLLLLEPLVS